MVEAEAPKVTITTDQETVEGNTCYTVDSNNGLCLQLIPYGATMLSVEFKNKDGVREELTLNRDAFEDLSNAAKNPKYGVTCGRVAGRIAGAKFTIGETEYRLEDTGGGACLHGGSNGFDRYFWDAEVVQNVKLSDFTALQEGQEDVENLNGVKFTRTSPDME